MTSIIKTKNQDYPIPPEVLATIMNSGEKQSFQKGELLYHAGEAPPGLFLLRKGLVGLALVSEAGREQLVRLFGPNDFLSHRSLLAEEHYHANATALEASEVQFVPKDLFFGLVEKQRAFAHYFLKRLAIDLGDCERRLKSMAEADAQARVAAALVYLKDLHAHHVWTRKEIADFAGTTTETTIRSLGKLEEEGLIKQVGRPIEILKRASLIQKARFD